MDHYFPNGTATHQYSLFSDKTMCQEDVNIPMKLYCVFSLKGERKSPKSPHSWRPEPFEAGAVGAVEWPIWAQLRYYVYSSIRFQIDNWIIFSIPWCTIILRSKLICIYIYIYIHVYIQLILHDLLITYHSVISTFAFLYRTSMTHFRIYIYMCCFVLCLLYSVYIYTYTRYNISVIVCTYDTYT